jgi:hypothetical protein
VARVVRRDEGDPDEQQRENGKRHGDAPALRGGAAAPQPGDALGHRRREQGERDDEQRLRQRTGQDLGGGERQHDPLHRRDDPAPAARRQRRAHPRQQPLAGQEQVPGGPDREHPRAVDGGDVDAEGKDQEGVDLAVEARSQRGRRPGAPRHPSVGQVQRERDGGERHEQRDGRGRVHGQRGDADGERGARERHPGRRSEPLAGREAEGQRRRHDQGAGDAGEPASLAEPGGPHEDGEQQHLGDQPDRGTCPSRSQRGAHSSWNRCESA